MSCNILSNLANIINKLKSLLRVGLHKMSYYIRLILFKMYVRSLLHLDNQCTHQSTI